ncbi:hypothetical protein Cgig2_015278 [Carnegiea gigantea]|uniref:Uncharacterized protein n=1 Tax=Carnegiea gigantea TaxID=171969 RepID=A0A9Q1K8K8_9CARY|nr:hypothetical protein Cgig2_015278 [Carnegiea gigantea]
MDLNDPFPEEVTFIDECGTLVRIIGNSINGNGEERRNKLRMCTTELWKSQYLLKHNKKRALKKRKFIFNQHKMLYIYDIFNMLHLLWGLHCRIALPFYLDTMDRIWFWNIRGLNGLNKQEGIKNLLLHNKFIVLGLMENKIAEGKVEEIHTRMGKQWFAINNATTTYRNIYKQLIHACYTISNGQKLFTTCVYRANDAEEVEVEHKHTHSLVYWGGFNSPLNTNKRISGNNVTQIEVVLINEKALLEFPKVLYEILPEDVSVRNPLQLAFGNQQKVGHPPFIFFNMWTKKPNFRQIVQGIWDMYVKGTSMFKIMYKLKLLRAPLRKLNATVFSNIHHKLFKHSRHYIRFKRTYMNALGSLIYW